MVEEVKKESPKFKFKEGITGRDYIDNMSASRRISMQELIKMCSKCLEEPKMNYAQIVDLPIKDFTELIQAFSKEWGIDTNLGFDFLEKK